MQWEEFVNDWASHRKAIKEVIKVFGEEPSHDDERADTDFCQPVIPLTQSNAFCMQLRSTVFRLAVAFQIGWYLEHVPYSSKTPAQNMVNKQTDDFQRQYKELQKKVSEYLDAHDVRSWASRCSEKERMWAYWKKFSWEWEMPWCEGAGANPPQKAEKRQMPVTWKRRPKLKKSTIQVLNALKNPKFATAATDNATALDEMKARTERRLDQIIQDEDPANQIEDEYKSKHEKVFMWQTRRLFATNHMELYDDYNSKMRSDPKAMASQDAVRLFC